MRQDAARTDGAPRAAPRGEAPLSLDRPAIMGLIPHRDPMLLLDEIPWLEPGRAAVATAASPADRAPGVERELPHVFSPELLIEGLAQTAAAVLVAEGVRDGRFPSGEPQPGVLAAVPEMRFPARARGGERISFHVEVVRRLGRLVLLRAEAFAGASLVASGTLSIALGTPGG